MTDRFSEYVERYHSDRSPYELMRIFKAIFEDGNTRQVAERFNISIYDVRYFRQFPDQCALYALEAQQLLVEYYKKNDGPNYRMVANE